MYSRLKYGIVCQLCGQKNYYFCSNFAVLHVNCLGKIGYIVYRTYIKTITQKYAISLEKIENYAKNHIWIILRALKMPPLKSLQKNGLVTCIIWCIFGQYN